MPTVDDLAYLRAPVEAADLEWVPVYTRAPQDGKGPLILVSPFVNRTAILNRLMQVCGPDGFATDARSSDGHLAFGIGIRIDRAASNTGEIESEWVWKWDGTGYLTPDPPHFSADAAGKGDFSNGLKRCALLWGIGLDLKAIKALPATIASEGRFKTKIGNQVHRWEPPVLRGGPIRPGEVASLQGTRDNGGPAPQNNPVEKPKPPTQAETATHIQQCKNDVRAFMHRFFYQGHHLDAIVATHAKLKVRFSSGHDLGQTGQLEDWILVQDLTVRNQQRWDQAPKELAKEFPTSEERVTMLRGLMKTTRPNNQESVLIESAISTGWSDGVEYWIEQLMARTQ